MSEPRIPIPSDEVLAEVAARHRVTVKDLRFELEYPSSSLISWGQWSDLEGAAAAVYEKNKAIEHVAKMQADAHMKRLYVLADEYGVPWSAIVREMRNGDWPDEESAARALRDRFSYGRARVPWWIRWLL